MGSAATGHPLIVNRRTVLGKRGRTSFVLAGSLHGRDGAERVAFVALDPQPSTLDSQLSTSTPGWNVMSELPNPVNVDAACAPYTREEVRPELGR
jgi:hypothetical protein